MRHAIVQAMVNDCLTKLNWRQGLGVSGKSCQIPSSSGLYAYGVVKRVRGLTASVEWMYVGKAANLRARISSHDPRYEKNPGLQQWLRNPPHGAELWITEVPSGDIDLVEREVISSINPIFNINHRTNKQGKKVLS